MIVPGPPRKVRTFGSVAPKKVADYRAVGKKRKIEQTELYVLVLLRISWFKYIAGTRFFSVAHFRILSTTISGSCSDESRRELVLHLGAADEASPCVPPESA